MESQLDYSFQILIEEFESQMNKEKKNEIIELFKKHNEISSSYEFDYLKGLIGQACLRGDLEVLEIYLNESIEVNIKSGLLTFKINRKNKTASMFEVLKSDDILIVPRTIEYEGEEYLVTSIIGKDAFSDLYMKSIEFPSNSSVHTIYENAFASAVVESIVLPSSLIELKEGWCNNSENLMKISFSGFNDRFLWKDDKYLLGKSDMQSDDFDILLFARRDIKEAQIQSNIKIISSFAFDCCTQLSKVEFSKKSNLKIIEKNAFAFTKITQFLIPLNVSTICEFAFRDCFELSKIEIPNLRTIEKGTFSSAKITEIFIPSTVSMICEDAFFCCMQLSRVEFAPNSNLQIIGQAAFSNTKITQFSLPPNVSMIHENAFYFCQNLQIFEISEESKLRNLDQTIFRESSQVIVMIPQKMRKVINK